jgi:hypothetical protein
MWGFLFVPNVPIVGVYKFPMDPCYFRNVGFRF